MLCEYGSVGPPTAAIGQASTEAGGRLQPGEEARGGGQPRLGF